MLTYSSTLSSSQKRALKPHEAEIKEAAKNIVQRINKEAKVCTGVAQLVEIANSPEEYGHKREFTFKLLYA